LSSLCIWTAAATAQYFGSIHVPIPDVAILGLHHRPSTRRTDIQATTRKSTATRLPKLFDLHADPYERADITSNIYCDWFISNAGIVYGGIAVADNFLQTFKEFPPSQHAATFTIDQAVDQLKHSLGE
jgi:hypothetical protein